METGRGAEEGRARCQEPAEVIFSSCSLSAPNSPPVCVALLFGTNMASTMRPTFDHLYLELACDPYDRCSLAINGVASRRSTLAWPLFVGVRHLEAESMTEDFLCLCISYLSGSLLSTRRQGFTSTSDSSSRIRHGAGFCCDCDTGWVGPLAFVQWRSRVFSGTGCNRIENGYQSL